MALTFLEARERILREVGVRAPAFVDTVPLLEAAGRVLAEDAAADRDYPPFARSARDGYAVRAADLPGRLRIIGESKAGSSFSGPVNAGECVEIMTGAPLPAGADAVIMVEWTSRDGAFMVTERTVPPGDAFNPAGCEATRGAVVVPRGRRLGFTEIAMLAATGRARVAVFRKPKVAILSTGDEIVELGTEPGESQIRNSNSYSLAAQVARAGGDPEILPVARDNRESTWQMIEWGLRSDLLLISGGVSAGKYDIVETVLGEFGAKIFFDRVKVQPGQPLVFGTAQDRFFLGLPGNPASTMVTFEIFARAAVDLLSGRTESPLLVLQAALTNPFRHKPGLTRFLPANLSADGSTVTPVPWKGSGDLAALARSNCFLVAGPDREAWNAGELIGVLLK
ncbi:MAG: molybdopterin molybdotransferase MoeA [Bryobacteraceae bacterium]|nr:molybdopterin molybdotransferase MoeA [Bryobacteraceae bacterium]